MVRLRREASDNNPTSMCLSARLQMAGFTIAASTALSPECLNSTAKMAVIKGGHALAACDMLQQTDYAVHGLIGIGSKLLTRGLKLRCQPGHI